MQPNPKFLHLIEAVIYIAMHAKPNAVRGHEVCRSLGLPERYLEPEFQILARQGVIRSVRGPRGGYVLAKERRNITLADIYSGIRPVDNGFKGNANILKLHELAEKRYLEELGKISIEALCTTYSAETNATPPKNKGDFTI